MSKLRAVAKFRIHPGKGADFRTIAAQCLEAVKARDPGTSGYEWFINEAGTECIVLESYDSAEALLAHTRNVGALVGRLLRIADYSVDMLGDPTSEIRAALRRMQISLYGRLQGLELTA
jgi:quinol monooxygenase YgiN